MIAVVIANAVLALFVITSVVSLLIWGIVTDKRAAASQSGLARDAARQKRTRPTLTQLEGALEFGV